MLKLRKEQADFLRRVSQRVCTADCFSRVLWQAIIAANLEIILFTFNVLATLTLLLPPPPVLPAYKLSFCLGIYSKWLLIRVRCRVCADGGGGSEAGCVDAPGCIKTDQISEYPGATRALLILTACLLEVFLR